MENISNHRFLNYKHYDNFLRDKNNIHGDAIVFIQDKLRIWARGKEYICSGPGSSTLDSRVLSFGNGSEDLFKISLGNNSITLEDSNGILYTSLFTSLDEFNTFKHDVEELIEDMQFTVDTELNESSSNAVENSAIVRALSAKANKSDLSAKENTLTAGRGISINRDGDNTTIDVTIDTSVYVVVDELPETNIDPNKIYLIQDPETGDLIGWKYSETEGWGSLGSKQPDIDLSKYLTKTDFAIIARKHDYRLDRIEADKVDAGYVYNKTQELATAVDKKYVRKSDVYTPGYFEDGEGWGTDEPIGGDETTPTTQYPRMVTLTTAAYQALVEYGQVQPDVYYFTYEAEETDNWTFGGTFPITLSESDSLGAFPINLV